MLTSKKFVEFMEPLKKRVDAVVQFLKIFKRDLEYEVYSPRQVMNMSIFLCPYRLMQGYSFLPIACFVLRLSRSTTFMDLQLRIASYRHSWSRKRPSKEVQQVHDGCNYLIC